MIFPSQYVFFSMEISDLIGVGSSEMIFYSLISRIQSSRRLITSVSPSITSNTYAEVEGNFFAETLVIQVIYKRDFLDR